MSRQVACFCSGGPDIKTPVEHYEELRGPLADLKTRLDAAIWDSGIKFLDLLRYTQDHNAALPDFEVASEEESRERYLRIAAATLLSDPEPPNPAAPAPRTVEEFYDQELIRPVRRYFAELERSTEALTETEALALVDYAGYRGFKDEARTELTVANRRVLVTLHLLLARILGYEREGDDDIDRSAPGLQ